MTTISINEPKTILELAAINATLPLRMKAIATWVTKNIPSPEMLTTPASRAMTLVELAEGMLKALKVEEVVSGVVPVEEREGRFTITGSDAEQMLKRNMPIEHLGSAMFQVAARGLALIDHLVTTAEESLKQVDEFAKFPGIPEKPASEG